MLRAENPPWGPHRALPSLSTAGAKNSLLSEEWGLRLPGYPSQIWLSETNIGQRAPEAITLTPSLAHFWVIEKLPARISRPIS